MSTFIVYLLPVALILGIIALVQMSQDPEKYKGKWMAIFGVIFGAVIGLLLLSAYFFF